ncbi:MAG: prepilin-type N-terminal cleavage/methylation domain-containing protein [Acidobacteriota bacterium]
MFRIKNGKREISPTSQQGFSIVEMTVVFLVIAIIAAFSIPQVMNYLKRYRLTVSSRNVATSIQRARYLATSNNKRTAIILSSEQQIDIEEYDPTGKLTPQNKGTFNLSQGVSIASDAPKQLAFDGRGVITPMPKENQLIRVNGENNYFQIVTVSPTGQVNVSPMQREEKN